MENIFIITLVFMTFFCLWLGRAYYRIRRFLTDVLNVLNYNVGGISTRISESAEIAEAIQSKAPDLFRKCFGLAHWLHANDQFLVSLYAVVAEGLDQNHQRRVHEMRKNGREEIFNRIYDGAGFPAPSFRTNEHKELE